VIGRQLLDLAVGTCLRGVSDEMLADIDAVLRRIRPIDSVANSETNLFLSTRQGGARWTAGKAG